MQVIPFTVELLFVIWFSLNVYEMKIHATRKLSIQFYQKIKKKSNECAFAWYHVAQCNESHNDMYSKREEKEKKSNTKHVKYRISSWYEM